MRAEGGELEKKERMIERWMRDFERVPEIGGGDDTGRKEKWGVGPT